jgi:hypothetical protein
MAERPRTRGFWRGVLAGLVLSALAALVLAFLFPPLQPPEITPGTETAPDAPRAPGSAVEPQVPSREGLLGVPPPGPLIAGGARADEPPSPAGSPSLVPTERR